MTDTDTETETETQAKPLFEVLVLTGYEQASHPFVTHSDALHYYAECRSAGIEALYVNREGDEPVVTGLHSEPLVAWTTDEMRELFTVEDFLAPFVTVRRKSDGVKGSLQFTHRPRYYYAWVEES